mmetsp:Transcript_19267/g.34873  ORF Transcript_19267/g.34873 Transcript_19267/m.34873 type:complete len:338 (+) Transcript_19267:241-1254(+)
MPGPKMGPRPPDFDEALVRQSPTFQKWAGLPQGAKLKYACREFTKGHGQDEERLMRRIMIARRNNLKDHATLKKARAIIVDKISCNSNSTSSSQPSTKKRRTTPSSSSSSGGALSDAQVTKEMDVVAVEATRSYRKWQTLQDGEEFLYNQKYTKGKDGHDWLLRKNIWRRMRYRRENKKMVQSIKGTAAAVNEEGEEDEVTAAGIVDHALLAANASATSAVEQAQLNATEAHDAAVVVQHDDHDDDDEDGFAVNKAVEAAVAAAEQYVKAESINMAAAGVSTTTVHNPLEGTTATDEALDAAARLAAASTTVESDDAVAKLAAEAVAGGDETDVVQI